MSDGGKGSAPRPYSVSKEEFDNNWDRIFGKKSTQQSPEDGPVVLDEKLPIHFVEVEPQPGDLQINKMGVLEEYSEGNWLEIPNKK